MTFCIFQLINSSDQVVLYISSIYIYQTMFLVSFFLAGWQNSKPEDVTEQSNMNVYTSFLDQNQAPPKLEDFLGGDSTETQDSSLTHISASAAAAAYFNDHHHQDLKNITGFQAFSTNSGSEVDDSASVARTQVMCGEFTGQSIESRTELAYSHRPTGALSLGVNTQNPSDEKAIVAVDSDSCKKITDTFGQRTSIYRGVTR